MRLNCPQCGQPYQPEAVFCVECGRPRDSAPSATRAPSISLRNLMLGVVGLAGVLLIAKGVRDWPRGQGSPSPSGSASLVEKVEGSAQGGASPPIESSPNVPATIPTIVSSPAISSPDVQLPSTPTPEVTSAAPVITPSPPSESTPIPAPSPEAMPVLYQSQGDLDGDGQPEVARVVSLDGNSAPDSQARKQLQILSSRGDFRFVSEPFEEPFRTDLDHLAEDSQGKAGLHVLKSSSGYPKIRLLFAPCSGNFVDFHYNGQQFELAGMGD